MHYNISNLHIPISVSKTKANFTKKRNFFKRKRKNTARNISVFLRFLKQQQKKIWIWIWVWLTYSSSYTPTTKLPICIENPYPAHIGYGYSPALAAPGAPSQSSSARLPGHHQELKIIINQYHLLSNYSLLTFCYEFTPGIWYKTENFLAQNVSFCPTKIGGLVSY